MARLVGLRLKGFKTFARPTELLFEPGITVIIGPNGSGKSNLADAVLWALGEQSPTTIRGHSMQDVIFSGSDGRREAVGAEVSLVFDNAAGALPLDFSEIEITRWTSREGGSGYRLNGSPCRLSDIHELIAAVGLGREMHSVISQGRVEEFLASTPQTRRALLEEAAGLGRFKKRRQRTQAKLEKVQANLDRVRDVEREVRNALRPLKQQVTAAERYAQATEDLAAAQAQLALHELLETRANQEEAGGRLQAVQGERARVEEELAAVRAGRAREEELFAQSLASREELAGVYHQAKAEVERLRSRADSLRARLGRLEAERSRATRRREMAQAELAAARTRAAELEQLPGAATGRQTLVERCMQELVAAQARVQPALRAAEGEEDALKEEVFDRESARSRLNQERDFVRREMEERTRRREELSRLEEAAEQRASSLGEQLRSLQAALEGSRRQAGEAAASLKQAAAQVEVLLSRLASTERAEREAHSALEVVETRKRLLRSVLAAQEGLPPAARALRSRPGALTVVEALSVEPGYERAVAAALGPLAHAVYLPGERDAGVLDEGEGPVEVVWWGGPFTPSPADPGPLSPDGHSLWEVIQGPAELLASLKRLLPSIRLLAGERAWAQPAPEGTMLITEAGVVLNGDFHAARRGAQGAETLLGATRELDSLAEEQDRLRGKVDETGAARRRAQTALEEAEAALGSLQAMERESGREAAGLADETDLFRRRCEEAQAEVQSLKKRQLEEHESTAGLEEALAEIEARQQEEAGHLEEARLRLRAAREEVERLRLRATRVEQKRAQAGLLAARLKERGRLSEEEAHRASARLLAAAQALAAADRRAASLAELAPRLAELAGVTAALAATFDQQVEVIAGRVEESRRSADGFADLLREHGRKEAELQQQLSALSESLVEVQVTLAHMEDRADEKERELAELRRKHLSPRTVRAEEVTGLDREALRQAVESGERRRERIGPVNPLAEQEYKQSAERAEFLAEQRHDLEESLAELRRVVTDLDAHIESTFAEVFAATREHFGEMVKVLFPGGKGLLKMVEPQSSNEAATEDGSLPDSVEAEETPGAKALPGIGLEIKPPKKAPRSLSLLSGGEKALAAIAFLFALFLARPCPFYVLDEVEAALDDVNIGRFLSLVSRYQSQAQFIIITHQRRTMEIADTLYGVAMDTDGTSRVLSRRLAKVGLTSEPG